MKKLIRRWLGFDEDFAAWTATYSGLAEEIHALRERTKELSREALFKACDNSNAAEDREALEKLEARVKRIEEALVIIERKPGEPIQ